jgi:hypothetical protein
LQGELTQHRYFDGLHNDTSFQRVSENHYNRF